MAILLYFSLYMTLFAEFFRILDCYVAIVFPFKHQNYVTLVIFFALAFQLGMRFAVLARVTHRLTHVNYSTDYFKAFSRSESFFN